MSEERPGSPDVDTHVLAEPAFGLSSLRSSSAAGERVESSERECGDVIQFPLTRLHEAMNNHPAGKGKK
jgi:hypothetical protein